MITTSTFDDIVADIASHNMLDDIHTLDDLDAVADQLVGEGYEQVLIAILDEQDGEFLTRIEWRGR